MRHVVRQLLSCSVGVGDRALTLQGVHRGHGGVEVHTHVQVGEVPVQAGVEFGNSHQVWAVDDECDVRAR